MSVIHSDLYMALQEVRKPTSEHEYTRLHLSRRELGGCAALVTTAGLIGGYIIYVLIHPCTTSHTADFAGFGIQQVDKTICTYDSSIILTHSVRYPLRNKPYGSEDQWRLVLGNSIFSRKSVWPGNGAPGWLQVHHRSIP